MQELTLEEIQQESFKVLLKFKELCEANDWKYWLSYGTLIGAVRHNGFIPWDDDIDVWMPRSDYEKFIQYCIDNESELMPFTLKHYRTCKEYIYPIARLVDTRYKIDYADMKDYGLGLFIDIYPLDNIDLSDQSFIKKINSIIRKISVLGPTVYKPAHNPIKNILKHAYYTVNKNKSLYKLLKKIDITAQKYNDKQCEHVACLVWETRDFMEKRFFEHSVKMMFNGVELDVPAEYDALLTYVYGDYMKLPPEEQRVAHHFYSAYKK